MNITIDFQDIFERCMRETAYMGRTSEQQHSDEVRGTTDEKVFANQYVGIFHIVRIRGSDRPLLMSFIREGAHLLESMLHEAMSDGGSYTTESVSWEFHSADGACTAGLLEDALTAYALWRWLSDKLPEQAQAYEVQMKNTMEGMKGNVRQLRKPRKCYRR